MKARMAVDDLGEILRRWDHWYLSGEGRDSVLFVGLKDAVIRASERMDDYRKGVVRDEHASR